MIPGKSEISDRQHTPEEKFDDGGYSPEYLTPAIIPSSPIAVKEDLNFAHINLPEPTEDDLKWREKFDKKHVDDGIKPYPKSVYLEFLKYMKKGNVWRASYILYARAQAKDPSNIMRYDYDIGMVETYPFRLRVNQNFYKFNADIKTLLIAGGYEMDSSLFEHAKTCSVDTIFRWADFDPQNRKNTAMLLSICVGGLDDLKRTLSMGANIRCSEDEALSLAVQYQDLNFIKFLVAEGCSVFSNNQKAICLAETLGKRDIHEYLLSVRDEHSLIKDENVNSARKTESHKNEDWKILSDSIIQKTTTDNASTPTYIVYNIDFDTQMMTTVVKRKLEISATTPLRFDQIQSPKLIFQAYAKMTEAGHSLPDIGEIFNDGSKKENTVDLIKKVKPKGANNGA
jgi:hypothetical protein